LEGKIVTKMEFMINMMTALKFLVFQHLMVVLILMEMVLKTLKTLVLKYQDC
jgi:hypothetical protein